MSINKNHPKYNEYIGKCKKLHDEEYSEIEEYEKNRKKIITAFDGQIVLIHKNYAKKLKELQKEYFFLFE